MQFLKSSAFLLLVAAPAAMAACENSFADLLKTLTGRFSISCETDAPICAGLCWTAEIFGDIDLLKLFSGGGVFSGGVCLYPEVGSDNLYGSICIEADSSGLIPPLFGADSLSCTATIDGEACESCQLCGENGATFTCGDVSVTECIELPLPGSIFDVKG